MIDKYFEYLISYNFLSKSALNMSWIYKCFLEHYYQDQFWNTLDTVTKFLIEVPVRYFFLKCRRTCRSFDNFKFYSINFLQFKSWLIRQILLSTLLQSKDIHLPCRNKNSNYNMHKNLCTFLYLFCIFDFQSFHA